MALFTTFATTQRSRRRRLLSTIAGVAASLVLIVVGTTLGYDVGVAQRAAEVERMTADLARVRGEERLAVERAAVAEQQARAAVARADDQQRDLEAARPTVDEQALLDIARRRLSAGLTPARLAFVLREAQQQPACEKGIETRRVSVHTAASTVPAPAQPFAGERILVTVEGQPTQRPDGSQDASFDPGGTVTVRFLKIGREVTTAEGMLPLTHSVVLEGKEHLFITRPSDRMNALEVTMQVCRFP